MKKIFLGIIALTMCVTLTACGTSQSNAAVNGLGNQLDETINTVSHIQTVSPTDINLTQYSFDNSSTNGNGIYNNMLAAQNSLMNEEYYKMNILNMTAKIKNDLGKEIQLSKAQASALKDLTYSLNRYTNSVGYTRNELDSTVKSISNLKKNPDKNMDKINARLNRLACNSNARASYYENILNTLEQIENYISSGTTDETKQPNQDETTKTPNTLENGTNYSANENNSQVVRSELKKENRNENNQTNQNKTGLTKNIDTYRNPNEINENNGNDLNNNGDDCQNGNCGEGIDCPYPNNGQNFNQVNRMGYGANGMYDNGNYGGVYGNAGFYGNYPNGNYVNGAYPNGVYPYGTYGMNGNGYVTNGAFGYGMNGYGYNTATPYGYNANNINNPFNRFNPTRNTDTYAPMMRNVDTYRIPNPAYYASHINENLDEREDDSDTNKNLSNTENFNNDTEQNNNDVHSNKNINQTDSNKTVNISQSNDEKIETIANAEPVKKMETFEEVKDGFISRRDVKEEKVAHAQESNDVVDEENKIETLQVLNTDKTTMKESKTIEKTQQNTLGEKVMLPKARIVDFRKLNDDLDQPIGGHERQTNLKRVSF